MISDKRKAYLKAYRERGGEAYNLLLNENIA
jgi:hypothetical protein